MRNTLVHTLAAIVLGGGVSGCASGGMAQHRSGMMMDRGNMMMSMGPMVGCHGSDVGVDARLANMRSALHITGDQEALWTAYADAYRQFASSMGMGSMGSMGAMGAGHQEHANATVTERLQHHQAMMSAHLASLNDLQAALAPLYASLNSEQKAVADAMVCDRQMH